MFRKADRDNLGDISRDTLYAKDMLRTLAAQLKSLAEGQAQLNVNCGERLAALEKSHAAYAKDFEVLALNVVDRLIALHKRLKMVESKFAPPRAKPSKRRKAA
jgi:hypothetical protein